jgi:uncharacterized membrane protein
MDDPRVPKTVYFLMLIAGLIQWVHYYPLLPERMAAHFNYEGLPNGWQPKDGFFLLMLVVVVGVTAVIPFLSARLIAARPDNQINLPQRSYWLAPERREATFRFIGAQMAWFGCGVLFVLLFGTSLAIHANLSADYLFDNSSMIKVLGGFLLLTVIWMVRFIRHFSRVPADFSSHP